MTPWSWLGGMYEGGVHMLLILSPIVQSGGLIDNALAPVLFIVSQC